jgi:hypothetical protein
MNTSAPDRASVTVTPTFWDLFTAALTLIRYQGVLIIVHSIFPLAGLFILVSPFYLGHTLQLGDVGMALLAFLFTPLITAFSIWMLRRRNKLAEGSFTYTFDSEGMHTSGSTFDQNIKWPAILRVRQSKRFLFFFISPTRAHCISMAALKNQEVFDAVCDIAKKHTDFR